MVARDSDMYWGYAWGVDIYSGWVYKYAGSLTHGVVKIYRRLHIRATIDEVFKCTMSM